MIYLTLDDLRADVASEDNGRSNSAPTTRGPNRITEEEEKDEEKDEEEPASIRIV